MIGSTANIITTVSSVLSHLTIQIDMPPLNAATVTEKIRGREVAGKIQEREVTEITTHIKDVMTVKGGSDLLPVLSLHGLHLRRMRDAVIRRSIRKAVAIERAIITTKIASGREKIIAHQVEAAV
jgi:hypothetical protein